MPQSCTSTGTTLKVSLIFPSSVMRLTCRAADVQRAIDVAFKYRNYFRKDIIVDLIVYRRW